MAVIYLSRNCKKHPLQLDVNLVVIAFYFADSYAIPNIFDGYLIPARTAFHPSRRGG
jgi:hypothetical protein